MYKTYRTVGKTAFFLRRFMPKAAGSFRNFQ